MEFIKTEIEGVFLIKPKIFGDNRGYFFESFRQDEFEKHAGKVNFVQDNESLSAKKNVVRGLHFQKGEFAQAKLLRVIKGAVLDVAVDMREGSPTFGRYVKTVLSGENHCQFFIPRGMAHGFAVLEDDTVFQYKCDNYYNPASEGSYRWNDPAFGIDWGIAQSDVILSAKDAAAPFFKG